MQVQIICIEEVHSSTGFESWHTTSNAAARYLPEYSTQGVELSAGWSMKAVVHQESHPHLHPQCMYHHLQRNMGQSTAT